MKPQFEAGRDHVGKKGIVRDPSVHELVLNEMISFALKEGYDVHNLSYSPITGGDGNIEFLLHLRWEGPQVQGTNHFGKIASSIVKEAHAELKENKQNEKQEK